MKKIDKKFNKILGDFETINLHGTEDWYMEEYRRKKAHKRKQHEEARKRERKSLIECTPPWMFNESPRTAERQHFIEALRRVNAAKTRGNLKIWQVYELKSAITDYLYGIDGDMGTHFNWED